MDGRARLRFAAQGGFANRASRAELQGASGGSHSPELPMKWLLIVIGVLVLLVVIVAGTGFMLPVAHTARRSVTLRAAPANVWATVTDVAAYPAWRSDVDSVEVLAPVGGRPSWREKGENGEITYAMMRSDPPTRLVTRIVDRDLPFGGEWEYEITPEGTGSRIVITERGEVYNPVFRFVSRFVMGHTATIDGYLRALSAKFGETVTPVTISTGTDAPAEATYRRGRAISTPARWLDGRVSCTLRPVRPPRLRVDLEAAVS